ncbi:hypothetical protein ACF07L_37280 [Streptomyces anulatus]|uniref:hypothetical protein n=1 Tax=Streptomyces anulatus TaxID=1892 RepID=UPI0036F5607A
MLQVAALLRVDIGERELTDALPSRRMPTDVMTPLMDAWSLPAVSWTLSPLLERPHHGLPQLSRSAADGQISVQGVGPGLDLVQQSCAPQLGNAFRSPSQSTDDRVQFLLDCSSSAKAHALNCLKHLLEVRDQEKAHVSIEACADHLLHQFRSVS